ncbi:hypothetical protein Cni_G25828 [Canna indica]|uniref:Uncharacterized protein n=1 Tax=Canna indica TaxID=4628 RepID=A0AAQ3QMT1_9LILI|nr:hypothetical protein Cni_G25828 [Canna indica]
MVSLLSRWLVVLTILVNIADVVFYVIYCPHRAPPSPSRTDAWRRKTARGGATARAVRRSAGCGRSACNSTLKMMYRNTGSFFGVHVTATPVLLNLYQLMIARGNVMSDKQQLYGGGSGLSSKQSSAPVNLMLSITVRSRAFVLGKLVKPKFYNRVQCAVAMDQTKLKTPASLKRTCQFSRASSVESRAISS